MKDNFSFQALGPDTILEAVESAGWLTDGRMLALNSYENRVYQIGIEDQAPVIVKFYRPNRWSDAEIAEEHIFLEELVEAEIPVVPPIRKGADSLFHFKDFRFSVFPRQGGRSPELDRPEVLEWMGRFLGRIHLVGKAQPFLERPMLDIQTFGQESLAYLLGNQCLPQDLVASYRAVAEMALQGVADCYSRAGEVELLRLHGDCHMGNVLWTDDGPHFVDFDDSRTGPAVQDLWMMMSGTPEDMKAQFNHLLAGYEDFCEFNPREAHLIEALRTLRLIHYSAWLARRWDDPAFPHHFPWFNTQQYWQERILELREQIALMQEPPVLLQYGNY